MLWSAHLINTQCGVIISEVKKKQSQERDSLGNRPFRADTAKGPDLERVVRK